MTQPIVIYVALEFIQENKEIILKWDYVVCCDGPYTGNFWKNYTGFCEDRGTD